MLSFVQIAVLFGVAIVMLIVGLFGSAIGKQLGVLWSKASGFIFVVGAGLIAVLAITAISAKCVEKCEVYDTTIGPIFATPIPAPTQTARVVIIKETVIVFVTPRPAGAVVVTPSPGSPCQVISGQGLGCRDVP